MNAVTFGDFLTLRTGVGPLTMMAAATYLLLAWLSGTSTGRDVLREVLPLPRRSAPTAAGPAHVPGFRMTVEVTGWASGEDVPHPPRVACANPSMCGDCRSYT